MEKFKIYFGEYTRVYDHSKFEFGEGWSEYGKGITQFFFMENKEVYFEIGEFKKIYDLDPDIFGIWDGLYFLLEGIYDKGGGNFYFTYDGETYDFTELNGHLYCEFKGEVKWKKEIDKEQFIDEVISFMTTVHIEAIRKEYFTAEDVISYLVDLLGKDHWFKDKEIQKQVIEKFVQPLKDLEQ